MKTYERGDKLENVDETQLIIAKANHLAFQLSRAFEEYAILRMEYDKLVIENGNLKNALPEKS